MGYQNEATAVRAVESVLTQPPPAPAKMEVVFVTSPGDRSARLIREAFPRTRVVQLGTRMFAGGARNAGLAATRGRVVAFLPADQTAEPGWVAGHLAAHRAGHAAVACAISPNADARSYASAAYFIKFAERQPSRAAGLVAFPDSGAHGLSYDRDLLERLGGFDATLPGGEDTVATRQLVGLGVPVWLDPAIRETHQEPATFAATLRDWSRRGALRCQFDTATEPGPRPGFLRCWAGWTFWCLRMGWRHGHGRRKELSRAMPWIVFGTAWMAGGYARERGRRLGGAYRDRTGDLLHAMQALSQLS